MIEIKHRYTGAVLCSFDVETTQEAVAQAIKQGIPLRNAYLQGAVIQGPCIPGADLRWADLRGAFLQGETLRGANLRGADFQGADFQGEKIAIAPIFISGLLRHILITESWLAIGPDRHTHESWGASSNAEIYAMDDQALAFWAVHKAWLLSACEAHKKQAVAARWDQR